jgi:hypothetical protein
MTEALSLPKKDEDVFALQPKVYDLLRLSLPVGGGAKIIEIKTTDKQKERTHPIEPPYLLVDTDAISVSDCIINLAWQYGEQESVSTVEVFCRRKDNWGEYNNEHVMSFHQPDGTSSDNRKETITFTILGNVSLYMMRETSPTKVPLETTQVA